VGSPLVSVAAASAYDPPRRHDDPRVCWVCSRHWSPWYPIMNLRSGKYHSGGEYGVTDCGKDATGDAWVWPT
jgi:hypothetical protein